MRRFSVFMRWLPALVILCVSWYLSSQQSINDMPVSSVYRLFMDLPSDEVIETHLPDFLRMDKIVHCVCFAAQRMSFSWGFVNAVLTAEKTAPAH